MALILCILLFLARNAQSADNKTLRGHVPAAAATLTPAKRLAGTNVLRLAIGLPLRNQAELTSLLHDLYDPASPKHGQFLTPAEFTQRFGPTEVDYQAVIAFAQTNGFTLRNQHPNRMLLDVEAPAAGIEKAFQIKLQVYEHPTENRQFFAPDSEPSVHSALPVSGISGLHNFTLPRPKSLRRAGRPQPQANPMAGSGPGGAYRGYDFRAAYVPGTTLTGAGQAVGLVQFDGYFASDIASYESQSGLPSVPLQNVLLDGFNGLPGSSSDEVSLDIEMTVSMAPGLSKIIVYEGGPSGLPEDILNRMATDNLAKQLSCSWGWGGGPISTTDQIFQQMAAQGQSFFVASGDSGAFSGSTSSAFPSDSPYITSVGGTTLTTTGPGGAWVSETVWNWGPGSGSSGGISTSYSIPSWQQGISTLANQGSTTLRNIPDVAMPGDNIWVVYGGGTTSTYGGTSCATPLWAGFMALVNQQAVAAGKPPIGFFNPALYAIGKSSTYTYNFHDITTGNNYNSGSPNAFAAVTGYDLCTGWGSPSGTNLINALAPTVLLPMVVPAATAVLTESCTPTNGVVDPGETVTMSFALQNIGTAPTTNLVATLIEGAGVLGPSAAQTYGALVANGATVSRSFSFTASGSCGGTINPTFQLKDGTAILGTVSFAMPLGKIVTATSLTQNFDGVTSPALPAGWTTATVTGIGTNWVTSTSTYASAPNAAFFVDSTNAGINALVSPAFTIVSPSAQLTFRQNYVLEAHTSRRGGANYYDGGILEIKIGNGSFTEILAAGGTFAAGGYNGAISTLYDNPLAGQQAWGGNSGGWVTTTVNLPASAAGQPVQLRWSCATDTDNAYPCVGWYVDSISLVDGYYSCCGDIADVSVTQSFSPIPAVAGQNATYSLTITNAGPDLAAGVMMTNTLPAGVTFVSASPGCTYANGAVICNIGTLLPNTASNLSIIVTPLAAGSFTNTANVAAFTPDANAVNNTSTLVASTGTPITINSQPTNQVVIVGGAASFQVGVTGTAPLAYQWYFNSTNLLNGATTNLLGLSNIQLAQAGNYSVIVTNGSGSVTSALANLRVLVTPTLNVASVSIASPPYSIAIQSVAGLNYELQYKDSLSDTNWTPVKPPSLGNGGSITLQDTNSAPATGDRFYRVICY